jgi:hypothetical protein
MSTVGAAPIRASVPTGHTEFTPLISGTAVRSAPGSLQPFDANALGRATRTLEAGRSWNAFAPVRASAPALESGPVHAEPVHAAALHTEPVHAEPVFADEPVYQDEPVHQRQRAVHQGSIQGAAPLAVEMPVTAGRYGAVVETPVEAPARPVEVPRQRVGEAAPSGLRRRVPGSQAPLETGPRLPVVPPTSEDALAARDLVEAFEAGVTRAKWDVIEADLAAPPSAGHQPLARRTPGATLPVTSPQKPPPPVAPAKPMDPDEARDLIEQFEYGVALALRETGSQQHEGHQR